MRDILPPVSTVWNHVEAAMALLVGGRRAEAERAYQWLAESQLPDGSWHHYYVDGGVEDPKFDANVCAYPATGVWHHFVATGDRALQFRGRASRSRSGTRPPKRCPSRRCRSCLR